jgi:hypothetical protein
MSSGDPGSTPQTLSMTCGSVVVAIVVVRAGSGPAVINVD